MSEGGAPFEPEAVPERLQRAGEELLERLPAGDRWLDARGAHVRVTGGVRAWVRPERGLAGCSCAAFGEFAVCAHVWAAYRVAEGGWGESAEGWEEALDGWGAVEGGAWSERLIYALDVEPREDGALACEVLTQRPTAQGWGVPRPLARRPPDEALEPGDRAALTWLCAFDPRPRSRGVWAAIPRVLVEQVVPVLVETGRCRLRASGALDEAACSWEPEPAWCWLRGEVEGEVWRVWGSVEAGGEVLAVRGGVPGGVCAVGSTLRPLAPELPYALWEGVRQPRRLEGPDRDGWARAVFDLPRLPRLALPVPTPEVAACTPVLRARARRPRGLEVEVRMTYGEVEVDPESGGALLPGTPWRRRDLALERRQEALARGVLRVEGWGGEVSTSRVSRGGRRLVEAGWRVEGPRRTLRPAGRLRSRVFAAEQWLEVRTQAEFEGFQAAWGDLWKGVDDPPWVELEDGSWGLLPEAWRERLRALESLGERKGEGVRVPNRRAWAVEAWSETVGAEADSSYAALRERLRDVRSGAAKVAPDNFGVELRGYQQVGVGWLGGLRKLHVGGILADGMGLGKTVQALAHVAWGRSGALDPSLVVAPRSLVSTWAREAARCAPGLEVVVYDGPDRTVAGSPDVVITTYGLLRRDAERLAARGWDVVVFDEGHLLTNPATRLAEAARGLRAQQRVALTGTPVENHLGELYSLIEVLNPGLLPPGVEDPTEWVGATRPLVLRRTVEEVAAELPPRIEVTEMCPLGPEQRVIYEALRERVRTLWGQGGREGILEGLLRLRQAACHPGLIDPSWNDVGSSKLDALERRVREVVERGQKALVISQFASLLRLARERCVGVGGELLDGSTVDRDAPVRRFQEDPRCRLLWLTLKVGGLGLDLSAADCVILLDPWWNPAAEEQAIARAHRLGRVGPVCAVRLIAEGTIEERLVELQERKRALGEAIFEADEEALRELLEGR